MVDPLSGTLAVITFATAVKDIVELGQKIHESFAKVSKNLRNVKRAAREIKEMAEEIQVFYDANKDVLDSIKDFGMALEGLLNKFRSFEKSILPLLAQTDRRGPGLFLRWWWDNNKIEGRILDLESNIVKVMRRYMMSGILRNEVKLERVHQDANRGFTDVQTGMTQGFEVIRRDISALHITATTTIPSRSNEFSATASDEFDRNVVIFAQSTASTSAPMLRTPSVITEELMTAAYIKLQINKIATTVEKMSTLPASALDNVGSNSVAPFQLVTMLEQASMSITHLRHQVVRHVIGIRDLLETERIHTVSIHEGAMALNWLSTGLQTLGMGEESRLVREWAITLIRSLCVGSGSGQPDLAASLALNLFNQSIDHYISGNRIQSLQAVNEAYKITQNLRNNHGGKVKFQILYSDILMQYTNLVDNRKAIEMCIEAVQVLEDILNVQAYTRSKLPAQIQNVVHHKSSFVDDLFSSAPPTTALTNYAMVLHKLGTYLAIDGHPESTLDLQLLAIAVRRKMVYIHGHEHKLGLARVVLSLVHSRPVRRIPAKELVAMADECVQIFRELEEKNPLHYARDLVNAMWAKAATLDALDRDADAISAWEEVANQARKIVQDSRLCPTVLGHLSNQFRRLNRHDDAVRTGTLAIDTYRGEAGTRAEKYFNLSLDLQKLRRYKESLNTAQTSVELYQHLAMRDSVRGMGDLTLAFSNLSHCLAAFGDYSEAITAWKESIRMLDNFTNTNSDATSDVSRPIDKYLAALRIHRILSYVLKDEEECLMVGFTAVRHLRQMSELYPHSADTIFHLVWAEFRHAYNLLRVDRLQDGQQFIEDWFDVWSKKLEATPESKIESLGWHAAMINLKAQMLDGQGSTKQALSVTRKVLDIATTISVTPNQPLEQVIKLMIQEARLRLNLGDNDGALRVAEEARQLSRKTNNISTLGWSSHGVAVTALSCGHYELAIEAAQEGCDISDSQNWQINQDEDNMCMRPSLFSILSSAEANLGRRSTMLEYADRAVKESLDIREMKASVSATTAEQSYMETRGNMADILLATGDFAQARQICKERSAYFSKRVEKRMGDYRDLAPVLRMLGILCCSEGIHEEGDAAAKELSRIMKTLGSAVPSLQEEVKIRLRNQVKVPILKVLDDMQQKLDCGHQAEVLSLFEI